MSAWPVAQACEALDSISKDWWVPSEAQGLHREYVPAPRLVQADNLLGGWSSIHHQGCKFPLNPIMHPFGDGVPFHILSHVVTGAHWWTIPVGNHDRGDNESVDIIPFLFVYPIATCNIGFTWLFFIVPLENGMMILPTGVYSKLLGMAVHRSRSEPLFIHQLLWGEGPTLNQHLTRGDSVCWCWRLLPYFWRLMFEMMHKWCHCTFFYKIISGIILFEWYFRSINKSIYKCVYIYISHGCFHQHESNTILFYNIFVFYIFILYIVYCICWFALERPWPPQKNCFMF